MLVLTKLVGRFPHLGITLPTPDDLSWAGKRRLAAKKYRRPDVEDVTGSGAHLGVAGPAPALPKIMNPCRNPCQADSRSHDPSNAQKTQAGLIPFSHTL